jgi:hypothetical protein
MRFRRLILQLNEQINPATKNRIDGSIKAAEQAIEAGYFPKVADQKQISSRLSDLMSGVDSIGWSIQRMTRDKSKTIVNDYGFTVHPYLNDAAEKLDKMSVPSGTSEKSTKAWTDLARKAFGSEIDDEIEMMIKLTELRVKVLELPINKPDKAPSKTAITKQERDDVAMTCQVCGGKYLASRGKIAHHGYQRPGFSVQTPSCFGALFPPFEVSRDRLGDWINSLKSQLDSAKINLKFVSESPELTLNALIGSGRNVEHDSLKVTAQNFDEMKKKLQSKKMNAYGDPIPTKFSAKSFDDLRKNLVSTAKNRIDGLYREIENSERRYDKWNPQD